MADDKNDKDADGWGDQFDAKDAAPTAGVSKEMLRKAMSLNPKLREQTSTNELMSVLGGGQVQRPSAPAEQSKGVDLVTGLTQCRARLQDEKKRLQGEIVGMQKQLEEKKKQLGALPASMLDPVLDLFIQIDPNLTSITTQEMLKQEAAFLSEIGFSAKKVVEKILKKKR
jgi:hypothetical protein